MDYTYDGMDIFIEDMESARESQMVRMLTYFQKLRLHISGIMICEKKLGSNCLQTSLFWDKESALEQRIYGKMKKWEKRHPIMGIVIGTMLGGILISLVVEIILNGIMMV